MKLYQKGMLILLAMGTTIGAEPAPAEPFALPAVLNSVAYLLEEDVEGDTLLLKAARAAYSMPEESRKRLFDPFIRELLLQGDDPLHENKQGFNTIFYLVGLPGLYDQLLAENLIPRELSRRIPHEEGALLRYMRKRYNQAAEAKAAASREYLVRRYCTPAYARAERLLRSYVGAPTLSRLPESALETCLHFMYLANPRGAEDFINSLTFWEHGEHFLEELPAHLLLTLYNMKWRVDTVQLRRALNKLATLLPESKDDMIECAASVPMSRILEMLTTQEGIAALPDVQRCAAAFDPEMVHHALLLQMKLQGLPYPGTESFAQLTAPELVDIRNALTADELIRKGNMEMLTASQLHAAAAVLRKHQMPNHADMMEGIVEGDTITLRPELRPFFRTRYEELREESPHVVLLRYLIEHRDLLLPQGEVKL